MVYLMSPNKPLEWAGGPHHTAAPLQAPCLPLRGNVGPSHYEQNHVALIYDPESLVMSVHTSAIRRTGHGTGGWYADNRDTSPNRYQ